MADGILMRQLLVLLQPADPSTIGEYKDARLEIIQLVHPMTVMVVWKLDDGNSKGVG